MQGYMLIGGTHGAHCMASVCNLSSAHSVESPPPSPPIGTRLPRLGADAEAETLQIVAAGATAKRGGVPRAGRERGDCGARGAAPRPPAMLGCILGDCGVDGTVGLPGVSARGGGEWGSPPTAAPRTAAWLLLAEA